VASWRDEIIEAAKSKAERDAEEAARQKKRVEEALGTARASLDLAIEAIRFTRDRLLDKGQDAKLDEAPSGAKLSLREHSLQVDLSEESAVLKVSLGEAKPREFDFAKDRHIAPADVEEYVGRRALELVRNAQKSSGW
jgi:hypothetical protein